MPQGPGEPLAPYLFGLGSRIVVACALVLLLGSALARDRDGDAHTTTEPDEPLARSQ